MAIPDLTAFAAAQRPLAPAARQGRQPPQSLELERAVLAVLLDGRNAVAMQVVRAVANHPLAFFHRDHRIVYLACLEIDDDNQRVEAQGVIDLLARWPFATLMERLRHQQALFDAEQLDGLDRGRLRALYRRDPAEEAIGNDSALAAIGGPNVIFDLMQSFAPAAGLARNIELVWDLYLKRRLIQRLEQLCDRAYLTTEEFPKLLDDGNQAVLDLNKMNRLAEVHGMGTAVDETVKRIIESNLHPEQTIQTGIHDLDQSLRSLRPGGLYVLAARPGVGKTSLALKIVSHIVSSPGLDQGVLFFSLEVDRIDLLKKLLSAEARIPFAHLDTGAIDGAELQQLEATAATLKTWPLYLMDVTDLTVQGLRSVVRRQVTEAKGKLKLIVLDYLQLLGSTRPDANEYEKVSEISRVLKVLAMTLKVPVIALSQMSRDSEKGVGSTPREPRLSDLRGSGSIEQDADAVIFIHRVDAGDNIEGPRRIKIIVAKNRFGPPGAAYMHFYADRMGFEAAREEDFAAEESKEGAGERKARTSRVQRLQQTPSKKEDGFASLDEDGESSTGLF